jgi:zinc transporter
MKTDSIPGFICAYSFAGSQPGRVLREADVAPLLAADGGWLWLHLNLADWRCRRWLSDYLAVSMDVATIFADPPRRQSIAAMPGLLCGHVADFRREFDHDSTEFAWLHFLLGERLIVTGRVKAVQSAERMRAEISRGAVFRNPAEFLTQQVANYADTLDGVLHRLMDELEAVEDHVLSDRFRGERLRLMLARRETAQLHRHMRSLRRALNQAERNIPELPDGLAQTASRLVGLDQDFEALEARARFFHDEIDAKLAAQTNRQLYILSALTAAFLPPTLVAGLFGMNLPGIPWTATHWGFWGAVGLAALSSGLVILYLRVTSNG